MRTCLLGIALLCGCSAMQRQVAYDTATAARELADESAAIWKDNVAARVEHCRGAVPKETSTQAERENCLGPFNNTDYALVVFKKIVAAQQLVYLALTIGSIQDVQSAMVALRTAMAEARPFLDAVMR